MSLEQRAPGSGRPRLLTEFDGFQEFVERCSARRLSETGMFLESPVATQPGAEVEFEVRVRDGFRLLRGRGVVLWHRPTGVPAGSGGTAIRFIHLDEPSRLLLRKIVQRYRGEGHELFDPEAGPVSAEGDLAPREPPVRAAEESLADLVAPAREIRAAASGPPQPFAGSAAAAPSRFGWSAVAAAGLLGLIAGAGVFYYRASLLSVVGLGTTATREAAPTRRPPLPAEEVLAVEEAGPIEESAPGGGAEPVADSGAADPAAEEAAPSLPPAPASPLLAAADPLTAIDSIFWQEEAGETVVVLVADGLFRSEGYASLRIPGSPPRLLVKIPGVRRPFSPGLLAVDSPHVLRVRTGLHDEAEGSTLHVVADLISDRVQLQRIEPDGTELRVVFADS